jgi:hypothetical protein
MEQIGFIGLGLMGKPMAMTMAQADAMVDAAGGFSLVVPAPGAWSPWIDDPAGLGRKWAPASCEVPAGADCPAGADELVCSDGGGCGVGRTCPAT